jgi:hypothetical protein
MGVVGKNLRRLSGEASVPSDVESGSVPEAATSSGVANSSSSSAILDFIFSALAAQTNTNSPGFSP